MLRILVFLTVFLSIGFCGTTESQTSSFETKTEFNELENNTGGEIESRFKPPTGYSRKTESETTFDYYLRHLPLKPPGTKVKYYDGRIKQKDVYEAVVNMDIGKKDLQQCADAVMRLRGEYLFAQKKYKEIEFNLTNGFKLDYNKWASGNRVRVNGNITSWYKASEASNTYGDFRKYMDFVFIYGGTLSLSKSLKTINLTEIAIGDVFIQGGSPGHAVIVVDIAENQNGQKAFMLAQSYMPAQDI